MQAIGLIETKGLIASIEAADSMLKAADVKLLKKERVSGGITTVIVQGDVAAVKAAVDAGAASVRKLGECFLRSQHVIPRPNDELEIVLNSKPVKEVEEEKIETKIEEELEQLNKEILDTLVEKEGFENSLKRLNELKVLELRELLKEFKDIKIESKKLNKLSKDLLIEELKKYYVKGDDEDAKL